MAHGFNCDCDRCDDIRRTMQDSHWLLQWAGIEPECDCDGDYVCAPCRDAVYAAMADEAESEVLMDMDGFPDPRGEEGFDDVDDYDEWNPACLMDDDDPF